MKSVSVKNPTLSVAWQLYQQRDQIREITRESYRYMLHKYLGDWMELELRVISRAMVMSRHKMLTTIHGKGTANLTLKIFRTVFNYARAIFEDESGERLLKTNPVEVMKEAREWNRIQPRTQHLSWSQYREWCQALENMKHETMKDFLVFCALTGCRRKEALDLEWENVNLLERRVVFRQTKNGGDHRLPVCRPVVELLEKRQGLSKGGKYVFFSPRHPFSQFSYRTHTIESMRQVGQHVSPHGLRRSYATLAAHLRVDALVIARILNHCNSTVTEHYIIRNLEPFRPEIELIGGTIARLMHEDVVNIPLLTGSL